MGRLRTVAALLAIMLGVNAVLLARAGAMMPAGLMILAAGTLAFVAPFPAPSPSQRKRFALACLVALIWTAGAALLALTGEATRLFGIVAAGEAAALAVLLIQAYRTRNRRRQTNGFQTYFIS